MGNADDFFENAKRQLEELGARQDSAFSFLTGGKASLPGLELPLLDKKELVIPRFEMNGEELQKLKELPKLDESVFAKWQAMDIPMVFAAGILGALSSLALKDYFKSLHNKWGGMDMANGGHHNDLIDKVPSRFDPTRPNASGGIGHRFLFGHDAFNMSDLFVPHPADPTGMSAWQNYMSIAAKSGNVLPGWMQAFWLWFRHLIQDAFSAEGLLLPGHSLLRDCINPAKTAPLMKYLGTIKMRDIAGAGVTNLIMGAYVWGTEKEFSRVFVKANYRGFALMAGANLTAILTGLLVPPPATSLNWGALPVLGYYVVRLLLMERKLHKELDARDAVLAENETTLLANLSRIAGDDRTLKKMLSELDEIDARVQRHYQEVNDRQDVLAKEILGE